MTYLEALCRSYALSIGQPADRWRDYIEVVKAEHEDVAGEAPEAPAARVETAPDQHWTERAKKPRR